jgi:hypothetical protein
VVLAHLVQAQLDTVAVLVALYRVVVILMAALVVARQVAHLALVEWVVHQQVNTELLVAEVQGVLVLITLQLLQLLGA